MASPVELVGQKLGHYLIKEQIGAGGMGVVFLAYDERLERDVAIKVLPANTFADQSVRKRFRKEALTLSKLNHPNIATIFDFNEENEICFLVTEYISGPAVDIIVNAGALPESQIVSLGLQLADALIAAHEKGVVHCDLKPENLRLTPDGRLKVLDFGIARLMHKATDENEATMTMTMTQTNEIRGTLPYMAPEQLLGEQPDARTDIWATGAVLYQLSAGSRPFQGKVATALAAEIIHTTPPQLSGLRKGLSPLLEGAIMKCLEKKAEHRYQTARELKVDLDRVLTRQGTTPVYVPKTADLIPMESGRKVPWKLVTACLLLALLLVGGWYWRQPHLSTPAKSSQRQSVAVLGFANATANKQDDWISSILTAQLPNELAAAGKVRIISDEDVGRAKQDLALNVSGSLAGDTLTRINRRLNADLIVVGSYSNLDGNIQLNLSVQDTKSGETIASPSEHGNVKNIEQLVTGTGITLRQALKIDQVDAATAELMRASMPSNTQAAQNYAEGVTKLRMSDALGARDLLQKAIASDPNYAMAHSALSTAWDQLGYDSKKQEEAKRAFDLSGKLLREQKLLVEARYREATSEWDKAADIYRNLQSIAPDELDYGLRLASTQIRGNKAQEALSTIQKLRALPAPQRDDPRIDMAEAEAGQALSDPAVAKAATALVIKKAQETGARSLVAQAEWRRCSALRYLGELDTARSASEHALQIYKETSDLLGQARSLTCTANVLSSKGNTDEALRLHEQALVLANSIGAKRDSAGATINIANILSDRGDSNGAIQRYQQAVAITREIGDPVQAITAENNLGVIYLNQGKFESAIQAFESSRKTAKEAGDLVGLIEARINLSTIHLRQGHFSEAKDGIQEAITAAKQLGVDHYEAEALEILGDVLLAEDDMGPADRAYSESLNIQTKSGDKYGIANSRLSLAELELERTQLDKAETLAGQAAQEFSNEKNADLEAAARIVSANALLAQNKMTQASDELAKVEKLQPSDSSIKLDFVITQGRVLAHTEKPAIATGLLQKAVKEASKIGLKSELELRLATGEVQFLNGDKAQSKATLRRVQKDASSQGFKLIARKAASALAGQD
jgi:serine/threonine protein kinase/tetratricopeptide (TPR) repeat protein